MKAHIGVDADSGLVHTVVGTATNANDVTQAHGKEADVFGDAGYQGVDKREETQKLTVRWHVALHPGKRRALDKATVVGKLADELERVKARIRAKAEHPFRVIKRQFGHLKVRYRGLMKNTQQVHTLFALSNLWMMRGRLTGLGHCTSAKAARARRQSAPSLCRRSRCIRAGCRTACTASAPC